MWENTGDFEFRAWADTLRDASGAAIFSDRQNISNALDLDCDGRLDLMIGRLDGTVSRYEATKLQGEGVPTFELLDDTFEEIRIVAQITPSARHGANTLVFHDADGDDDPDLFWGDFFEPGLLLIENRGTCDAPDLTGAPQPFPLHDPVRTSGYNAPTFGDVDGDGGLDLLMGVLGGAFNANATTADNLLYFEQVEGRYELRTRRYLTQIDVGSEATPAVLDLDGDGDPDLVVSNKIDPDDLSTSRLHVLENTGASGDPAFRLGGTLDVRGAYHNAPAFGDLDGDGRPDLVLGTWRDELRYLRNEAGPDGSVRFAMVDSAFVTLTRGSNATPALGDLDGDGDLDLLVGESSGHINFYRNEGSPSSPRFVLVSDEWGGIKAERRSVPALADWDRDGNLDLLLGSEREGVRLFLGEGAAQEPRFVETDRLLPPDRAPAYSAPLPVDLDGDGDLDLMVGGVGGGLYYFERAGAP
ncbi:MAG: VCBS repeat-containing protein [Gemmatimonadetes bacterium]|nr:VCBS repeat-containing protein [Gemmatimonadota bacterium]